jgi:uncharacterized membrane protein
VTVVLGCLSMAFSWQSILAVRDTATVFLSPASWLNLVSQVGGSVETETGGTVYCLVPFLVMAGIFAGLSAGLIGVSAAIGSSILKRTARNRGHVASQIVAAWRWWLIPGVWELSRILLFVGGASFADAAAILTSIVHYVMALAFAGWLVDLLLPFAGSSGQPERERPLPGYDIPRWLAAAFVVYVIVFTTMNWQLYHGLLVPHGDSAMYEEHLWNITHGKGFRSYLDQGLFLGEHIQVVHLLLLPLYALWPSHLLLELCESLALGAGAFPIFWITNRATGSRRCACFLAIAFLLYPPLQFLDIAADLKTFRPISFGVPALLFALDQMERKRVKTTLLLFALALSAKEDYAIILGPLGLWIAAQPLLRRFSENSSAEATASDRRPLCAGLGLAVFAVAYLLLATRVVIPSFRDGAELHYVGYFSKFGGTFGEVVTNMLTNPQLLFRELVTVGSGAYLLALLFPLAMLPLLSPTRFAVAAPILGLLCLNELIKLEPQPWHHFHAPVVPVLFWAAAHGAGRLLHQGPFWLARLSERLSHEVPEYMPGLVLSLCLCFGAFVGSSPLGVRFWDPDSFYHWRSLYVPGPRTEAFARVLEQIPQDARVASTDFVHPRFTHHERSYDYSSYRREVASYEDRVPDDTDFIVIDTRHHYSEIQTPDQVRELQNEPQNWQLLDDLTDGHFIVLRRRID